MLNIKKVMENAATKIIESGIVEKTIEEKVVHLIEEAVKASLSSYSELGKQVQNAVKEAMKIEGLQLSFPVYNSTITSIISNWYNNNVSLIAKKEIEERLKTLSSPLAKREWKVSEIVEKFKEHLIEDESKTSGEITLIVEKSTSCAGYFNIYLDKEDSKTKYRCDYQLDVSERGVYSAKMKGYDAKEIIAKPLYNFDDFMFKLYAMQAIIIDDSKDAYLEINTYED